MLKILYFKFFILLLFSCEKSKIQKDLVPNIISKNAIKFLNNKNYFFLDVRSIHEHQIKSIPNTKVIPVNKLSSRLYELEEFKEKEFIVYCRSGNRSKKGTEILYNNGFNARNLIGGIKEWQGPIIEK